MQSIPEQPLSAAPPDAHAEEYSLERTGEPPLTFKGTRIGFGTTKTLTTPEWTEVTIYKTAGGSFVADVDVHYAATGAESCQALTFASAKQLVAALRGPDGMLDRAAQAACQAAAKSDAKFLSEWVERVP